MFRYYESLDKIPGVFRDRYGNPRCGRSVTRGETEFVLELPKGALQDVILSELLNWIRWGSQTSVMWECTLPELIQIIEKWHGDNPNAPKRLFDPHITSDADWESLWIRRGVKGEVRRAYKCCGLLFPEYQQSCTQCDKHWTDMQEVWVGQRGEGTYNLILEGADGSYVAAAVYTSRNWILHVPDRFQRNPYNYLPPAAEGY